MTPRQRERLRRAQERRRRGSRIDVATIAILAGLTVCALLFALALANWALGCGQTYATASGDRIAGECILLDWRPTKE